MKSCFWLIIVIIANIDESFELCTSTPAFTKCENEKLSTNHPLRLQTYKPIFEVKNSEIEEIPPETFRFLPEITSLSLSFGTIERLKPGCFKGLNKLTTLLLNYNLLEEIRNHVFDDCPNLIRLDLGGNKIRIIERNAFSQLIDLEELNLSFNRLKKVPESLSNLNHLKILNLKGNRIEILERNCFNGLTQLETLDLENNKIRQVDGNVFQLPSLKEINLKDNYLSDLDVGNLVNNSPKLETIKLNLNNFVCQRLNQIVQQFQDRRINVERGISKSNVTVHGIACRNS